MGDWTGAQNSVLGRMQSCTSCGREVSEIAFGNIPSKRKTKFQCRLRKIGNFIRGSRTILLHWFMNIVYLNESGQEQKRIFEGPQTPLVEGVEKVQQGQGGPHLKPHVRNL